MAATPNDFIAAHSQNSSHCCLLIHIIFLLALFNLLILLSQLLFIPRFPPFSFLSLVLLSTSSAASRCHCWVESAVPGTPCLTVFLAMRSRFFNYFLSCLEIQLSCWRFLEKTAAGPAFRFPLFIYSLPSLGCLGFILFGSRPCVCYPYRWSWRLC